MALAPLSLIGEGVPLHHQSETCAQAARAKLEFTQEAVPFPSRMISWVLGKNGEHVREIQQMSGVTRIFIGNKCGECETRNFLFFFCV
jgi:hypothetical protein